MFENERNADWLNWELNEVFDFIFLVHDHFVLGLVRLGFFLLLFLINFLQNYNLCNSFKNETNLNHHSLFLPWLFDFYFPVVFNHHHINRGNKISNLPFFAFLKPNLQLLLHAGVFPREVFLFAFLDFAVLIIPHFKLLPHVDVKRVHVVLNFEGLAVLLQVLNYQVFDQTLVLDLHLEKIVQIWTFVDEIGSFYVVNVQRARGLNIFLFNSNIDCFSFYKWNTVFCSRTSGRVFSRFVPISQLSSGPGFRWLPVWNWSRWWRSTWGSAPPPLYTRWSHRGFLWGQNWAKTHRGDNCITECFWALYISCRLLWTW